MADLSPGTGIDDTFLAEFAGWYSGAVINACSDAELLGDAEWLGQIVSARQDACRLRKQLSDALGCWTTDVARRFTGNDIDWTADRPTEALLRRIIEVIRDQLPQSAGATGSGG